MKALPSPVVNDNEQKMKLEAFLQRLLFPEIQEMPTSLNNDSSNRNSEGGAQTNNNSTYHLIAFCKR